MNLQNFRSDSQSDGEGQTWRFRGQGSYVRVRRSDTSFMQGIRSQYVGFRMSTIQYNSLVFLIGNTTVSC